MHQVFKTLSLVLFFIFCLAPTSPLTAHAPDQSYLYMSIYKDAMGGRFELTAKDINRAIGTNLNDVLTQEAINPHVSKIRDYILSRTSFQSSLGKYTIKWTKNGVLNLGESPDYGTFSFDLEEVTKVPESLDVKYDLIFDKNDIHRGMLIIEYNWKAGIVDNESLISNIFSPENTTETLSLKELSLWKGFWALIKLGVWHIWIGLDHILFLVALILPSVVRRREKNVAVADTAVGEWRAVEKFKPAFFYIIKIVTFFTIAHSITLALAALGFINLSSRVVESIIAISIALAAFHNIIPIFKTKEWLIAFAFGLFHGFGFASVLGEKGLSGDYMILSLLGFNVGVELGQILIICMIFPVLFFIRKLKIYPPIIKYGSMLLILISIYWFIERWFEVDLTLGTYFWKMYNGVFG